MKALILLLGFCSGCASLYTPAPGSFELASSGLTGCMPKDILIADTTLGEGVRTWTAKCRGKVFVCSSGIYFQFIRNPVCSEVKK
jgi:hypothetical protein